MVDVNDQPPVLSQDSYNLNVIENTAVNTRFNLITASDADSAGPNSQITYSTNISSKLLNNIIIVCNLIGRFN